MDTRVMMLGSILAAASRREQARNREQNVASLAEMAEGFNWLGKLIGAVGRLALVRKFPARLMPDAEAADTPRFRGDTLAQWGGVRPA